MSATGQFWGSLTPTTIDGVTAGPTEPGQDPPGLFLLNIDEHRPLHFPFAMYRTRPPGLPGVPAVKFVLDLQATQNDGRIVAFGEQAYTVDPISGHINPFSIPARDGVPFRVDMDAAERIPNRHYSGYVRNSWGDASFIRFYKADANTQVRDITQCDTWTDYKSWSSNGGRNHFAFRGQANSEWQLKTSLHRSNRFDLWNYSAVALARLQMELEGGANAAFDRENPAEFARLLALAQHHGFPTPLLDFTRSPYIAAYFAMADVLDIPKEKRPPYVRIYALDKSFEPRANASTVTINSIEPTATLFGVSGRQNPRLYAQQGLFIFTNVELVEHLLTDDFYTQGATFLRAVDIPSSRATEALTDLAYMGISPATLFPGVDGVCMKLKQQLLTGTL